jgi:hypothetical protein
MRTYTHGMIGYLLYAKRSRQERHLAIMGSLLPDMLLAIGYVPHYLEHVIHWSTVVELHRLLHHSDMHLITVGMHSFGIVGSLFALSYVLYRPALPFFVGMLAHGIVDLLTHRQWAYNHFFPLPFAPIEGLFSYTDMGFTVVEHVLLLLFMVWWMLKRRKGYPGAQRKRPGLS